MYKITTNELGDEYTGLTLKWDYEKRTLDISIPGYVEDFLLKLGFHDLKGADSPGVYTPPLLGRKGSHMADITEYTPCTDDEKLLVQKVVGKCTYYGGAVDPSIVHAVNDIATSGFTSNSMTKMMRLVNYLSRYPNASIRYNASDMTLKAYSDASFLSETGARSKTGYMFYLGELSARSAPIECATSIIPVIVSSVGEAEYAGVFAAAQRGIGIKDTLSALGHIQGATEIKCDNACAVGLANSNIKEKMSKAIDKDFHWVRDRVNRGQYKVTWEEGKSNRADFFTKTLPVHEHKIQQHLLVHYPARNTPNNTARSRRIGKKIEKASIAKQNNHNIMVDSGTTSTFISPDDTHLLSSISPLSKHLKIMTATGNISESSNTGYIAIPQLPTSATIAHIVPGFSTSLMSVAAIVDAGMTVTFSTDRVTILKETEIILEGARNNENKLWYLPTTHTDTKTLSPPPGFTQTI